MYIIAGSIWVSTWVSEISRFRDTSITTISTVAVTAIATIAFTIATVSTIAFTVAAVATIARSTIAGVSAKAVGTVAIAFITVMTNWKGTEMSSILTVRLGIAVAVCTVLMACTMIIIGTVSIAMTAGISRVSTTIDVAATAVHSVEISLTNAWVRWVVDGAMSVAVSVMLVAEISVEAVAVILLSIVVA